MVEFNVGDEVIILDNRVTDGYQNLKGERGIIQKIIYNEKYDKKVKYRVAISGHINKYTLDGHYLFYAHEIGNLEPLKIRFKKEEKKKMEILKIYVEKQKRKLRNKFDKKMADLYKQDPVYRELCEMNKRIVQLNKIHHTNVLLDLSDYIFPQDYKTQQFEIEAENDRNFDTLCDLVQEVEAQLDMCETYEQKQQILKAYKIIDENGKIKN